MTRWESHKHKEGLGEMLSILLQLFKQKGFLLLLLVSLFMFSSCSSVWDNLPFANNSGEARNSDIVQAIRSASNGRSYVITKPRIEELTYICSQQEVDADPYMPNHPQLAKCPYVGARYDAWYSFDISTTHTCVNLPSWDSGGWYLHALGENSWTVNYGSSSWDVYLLNSTSAELPLGENFTVQVSGLSFRVYPNQNC